MSSAKHPKKDHFVAPRRTIFCAIAFCTLFACAGVYQIAVSLIPLTWDTVDCVVSECQLTDQSEHELPFSAKVLFEFEWKGKTYRSRNLGIDGWKKAERAITFQRTLEQKQFSAHAYMPTDDPNQAVLVRPEQRWGGLAFVLFGTSMSWLLIIADRYRDAPSEIVSRKITPVVTFMFGGVGLFLFFTLSLPVWIESVRIHTWQEIPATIVWSRERTNPDRGKGTCQPDICYEYTFANRIWRNNRLDAGVSVNPGSSHEWMAQYPKGKRTTCRIHPTDPAKTYLITKTSWHILVTLFPLPFMFVGYLGLRSLLKKP